MEQPMSLSAPGDPCRIGPADLPRILADLQHLRSAVAARLADDNSDNRYAVRVAVNNGPGVGLLETLGGGTRRSPIDSTPPSPAPRMKRSANCGTFWPAGTGGFMRPSG
jgi:hypothetical protein